MSFSFLLDENIPFALITLLEDSGFEVNHLKKSGKAGIRNGEVYELASRYSSWIVTRDSDFQSIYKLNQYDIKGVIVLKLNSTKTPYLPGRFESFLQNYRDTLDTKSVIIISDEHIRIYK